MNAMTRLSLRNRLAVLTAVAVTVAVALIAVTAWVLARSQLIRQVDAELLAQSRGIQRLPEDLTGRISAHHEGLVPHPDPALLQIVATDGSVQRPPGQQALPVTAEDRAVNSGTDVVLRDDQIEHVPIRILTRRAPEGRLLQIARPVTDIESTLHRLAAMLLLAGGVGVGLAVLAGRAVAKAGLAPVVRVAAAAEHVARTTDLTAAIPVEGDDEVARVARSLNQMLAALEAGRAQQRQLVEDAGHELRTPLTSLRANVDLLLRAGSDPRLSEADRQALLEDIREQTGELGALINEVIELGRGGRDLEPVRRLPLQELVASALRRVQRHHPDVEFRLTCRDVILLDGRHGMLSRAVGNLLDNAAKFSPIGATVEIELSRSASGVVLDVLDRGPGVEADEREKVFDRFHRTARARSVPGSGLGLSIVRQAAEQHGGSASLQPRPGGGTIARLVLPAADAHGRSEAEEATAAPADAAAITPSMQGAD